MQRRMRVWFDAERRELSDERRESESEVICWVSAREQNFTQKKEENIC